MKHYTLTFFLHTLVHADGTRLLYARAKWDECRHSLTLSTGFRVDPAKWDPVTQFCSPKSRHGRYRLAGSEINAEIVRYQDAVRNVFSRHAESDHLTPTQLREELSPELGRALRTVTVERAFNEFMLWCSAEKGWTQSTWKKLSTHKKHILGWSPFHSFAGFTPRSMVGYLRHLTDDEGLSNVTVHRSVGYLRWFLRWCEDRGYVGSEWHAFHPRIVQPEKPVVFLTWDELMRVWEYKAHGEHDIVRDIFLLQCFTSLRWSDVMALRWGDVTPETIRVTTQKTTDSLVIDLNKWSRQVLERQPKGGPADTIFPPVPNQVTNRYIKHICRDCGIDTPVTVITFRGSERTDTTLPKWQLMSSHAGRRTFICNALSLGIPPTTVMQWTGHSDYRAMKPYIAVAETARRQAMAAFDQV